MKSNFNNEFDFVLERAISILQDNAGEFEGRSHEIFDANKDNGNSLFTSHNYGKPDLNSDYDVEILEEAKKILNSPDPLAMIEKHLDNIVAGESENKRLVFLLLLSGKMSKPAYKQIILLKGEPGSGKSQIMKLADFFKVKDVGRFTAHALDYTDLQGYEVLRLKEIGTMDQENQGISTLKFLGGDDKGYTVEFTVRNEKTGRLTTEQRRIPPITIITSTIRVILDPQFERRAWVINLDESEEQTRRILYFKAKKIEEENLKDLGLLKETSEEHSVRVLRCLVSMLEPVKVLIPFPRTLGDIFTNPVLRVRGDYDKVHSLIQLHSLLNQNMLPRLEMNDSKIIIAKPELAVKILAEAKAPLTSMMMNLERRSLSLIPQMERLGIVDRDDEIDIDKRQTIARAIGRSTDSVTKYLNELVCSGYLSKETGPGRVNIYRLLYSLDEIKEKESRLSRILESPEILTVKMSEEADKWLRRIIGEHNLSERHNAFLERYLHDLEVRSHTTELSLQNTTLDVKRDIYGRATLKHQEKSKFSTAINTVEPTVEKLPPPPGQNNDADCRVNASHPSFVAVSRGDDVV